MRPSTNRPGNHQQRHTGRLLLRLKADRFGCIDKDQEYHLNNHALTVKDMEQIEDSFTEVSPPMQSEPTHHRKNDPPDRYLFVDTWQPFFLSKALSASGKELLKEKMFLALDIDQPISTNKGWVHK